MKKYKNEISLVRIRLKQLKIKRISKKSGKKRRQRNIAKNNRRKTLYKTKQVNNNFIKLPIRIPITALEEFSLLEFPENVLKFIKDIDDITKSRGNNNRIIIKIDLSLVRRIDIGSIGLLLSKINELSRMGIRAEGNFPDDEACKQMIFDSGFLEHMKDLKGNNFKLRQDSANMMVNRGFDKTSNAILGSAIRKAVKHLTGEENSYRPLYSMAQEMCANSVEHANHQNKNWLFSVWYKNQDVVCFTMTDIGKGILGTLKRKASQIIKELLLTDDLEILDRAFEKKYTSQTKEINRNKGLPRIKSISIDGFVDNLIVITNSVVINFSNEKESKSLKRKFDGTLYYWELNKNCIEKWKNRNN